MSEKSPHGIWAHCMAPRKALAAKEMSSGLNIVLMTVLALMNEALQIQTVFYTLQCHEYRIFSDAEILGRHI